MAQADPWLAKREQWHREYAALPQPHRRFRFHVVGLPATRVCNEVTSPCDTLTFGIRGIIRILHGILGHEVLFYGSDDSDIDCTQRVVVCTAKDRAKWYGDRTDLSLTGALAPPMEAREPAYQSFNRRVIGAIEQYRDSDRDFILVQGGAAQAVIADAFPAMHTVEFLIGYNGSFAKFRVFQTYTHMMFTYGRQGLETGREFDEAGFGFYYDRAEFPYSPTKGNYYLFCGRPYLNKQPHIAGQVCAKLGAKLLVAGQGARQVSPDTVECYDGLKIVCPGVEYVGVVGGLERAKLMGEALAMFAPTNYREPFASCTQEAAMCGTPSITTDHGCFPETIIQGLNGYRCRSFAQLVEAARLAPQLDSKAISDRAVALYSEDVLAKGYQLYFTRIDSLWGEGWYAGV